MYVEPKAVGGTQTESIMQRSERLGVAVLYDAAGPEGFSTAIADSKD